MRQRRAARVLLFAPDGDILLVRFVFAQEGGGEFVFWCAPGGEIEGDETEMAAAQREIQEELGLDLDMEGPFRVDRNTFAVRGQMCDNIDFYFIARCERDAPVLSGVTPEEITAMKEIRWWTVADLEQTAEKIFPVDLAACVETVRLGAISGTLGGPCLKR